jgi:hypothetical protein
MEILGCQILRTSSVSVLFSDLDCEAPAGPTGEAEGVVCILLIPVSARIVGAVVLPRVGDETVCASDSSVDLAEVPPPPEAEVTLRTLVALERDRFLGVVKP